MQEQELGMELRRLREEQGLTLEQVQSDTKIRSRYLEAIESGDLSILPGMVYARGFIKSYAEYLGINGHELIERHGLYDAQPEPVDTAPRRSKQQAASDAGKGASFAGTRLLPQIVAGVAVIGVLTAAYFFLINKSEDKQTTNKEPQATTQSEGTAPAQQTPAAEQPQPQQQAVVPTPPPEPPKPVTVVTESSKANNRTNYAVTGADAMSLELAASSDCWVQVTADGKVIETGIVKSGETRTWKADKALAVMTGKSKFITMKLNDQQVTFEPLLRGYTYAFERNS